jgi:hypothetical protein
MNYIDIAEAAKATGKNQITIRRLIKKATSAPYVRLEKSEFGDKYTLEVNYLFSQYAPLNTYHQKPFNNDSTLTTHEDGTQGIQVFERLLQEKEERIKDLKLQLDKKDDQLDKKDKIIESLTETMKLLPTYTAASPAQNLPWWKRLFK